MLLQNSINIKETCKGYSRSVELVVGFDLSPGLSDSDHRSSRYDRFRVGVSNRSDDLLFLKIERQAIKMPFLLSFLAFFGFFY